MANKCDNELYFIGDSANVKEANLFLAAYEAERTGPRSNFLNDFQEIESKI